MNYIRDLTTVSLADIPLVGGKTASLGEMIQQLTAAGVRVPQGFAITAPAYRDFLTSNNLTEPIRAIVAEIRSGKKSVEIGSRAIRDLIVNGTLMPQLEQEICAAYDQLAQKVNAADLSVAVRSSATAEDLPTASFAGQQETYLNVVGHDALAQACKACFASLFTERAMVYRQENHFDDFSVALSICVQQMVRSDVGASGIIFTLDTESGFKEVISISATYGLGESIVQGRVNPDEYLVYKQPLAHGQRPIIRKSCGSKTEKLVFSQEVTRVLGKVFTERESTVWEQTKPDERARFVLQDKVILELAQLAVIIEDHYSKLHGKWTPMDIEWAQDGRDGVVYIVQSRPETVFGAKKSSLLTRYQLRENGKKPTVITRGQSVGQKIASGKARVVASRDDLKEFKKGDVLVTRMTDPDWVAIMKQASAIVTDFGGRTCHAAIVSRELGIPAVVGTVDATEKIHEGQEITVDCSQGNLGLVYDGVIPFEVKEFGPTNTKTLPVALNINLGDPRAAFAASLLPVQGVGLARLEFIVSNEIGIHPMAVTHLEKVTDAAVVQAIRERAQAFVSLEAFYVETLARAVGLIAAAMYPRPVLVRLSDFKSNEYRHLLGGSFFEPQEENPMLGWRGAARYIAPNYESAFALECVALKRARDEFGFTNIRLMVPFVRTVNEAQKTITLLQQNGLERGKNGLEVYMMVEIPSNVLLLEQFAPSFDGFSIGSNDLTQLTLGVDRDSGLLSELFDERDPAVKMLLAMAITGAKKVRKPIGICGQAPSDYPEIAQFLIEHKIDSLSLSVDAVLPFIERYQKN